MNVRLIRAFDAMALAVLFFLVILLVPEAGRDALGRLTMVLMVPLLVALVAAFLLPAQLPGSPRWPVLVLRLRLCILATVGFAPFAIWWTVQPLDRFIMVEALLACYTGIAFFYNLNELAMEAALGRGLSSARRPGLLVRYGILYFVFCTFSSLAIIEVINYLWGYIDPLDALRQLQRQPQVIVGVAVWFVLFAIGGIVMPLLANRALANAAPDASPADSSVAP